MQVLNHGSLEMDGVLGGDLLVVNAARASYAKRTKVIEEKDVRLIYGLARRGHKSPFYHPQVTFYVRAPISVMREWDKHRIGTATNAESSRYVELKDEYYIPDQFHKQGDKKQGQGEALPDVLSYNVRSEYKYQMERQYQVYKDFLTAGLSRDEARELLPVATFTSFVWTASAYAIINFLKLRDTEDAHYAIRQYAKAMAALLEKDGSLNHTLSAHGLLTNPTG